MKIIAYNRNDPISGYHIRVLTVHQAVPIVSSDGGNFTFLISISPIGCHKLWGKELAMLAV